MDLVSYYWKSTIWKMTCKSHHRFGSRRSWTGPRRDLKNMLIFYLIKRINTRWWKQNSSHFTLKPIVIIIIIMTLMESLWTEKVSISIQTIIYIIINQNLPSYLINNIVLIKWIILIIINYLVRIIKSQAIFITLNLFKLPNKIIITVMHIWKMPCKRNTKELALMIMLKIFKFQ
jgi:hypothetical protein